MAAAHNEGDPLMPKNGSDYIFVVDVGGLRIAHFGDIGQTALTAGQLGELGDVDIAVTQFENSFSHMDATNQKGFRLMEQVKPRLILQTHTSPAAVQYAGTLWPVLYSERPSVTVTRGRSSRRDQPPAARRRRRLLRRARARREGGLVRTRRRHRDWAT